MKTLLALLIGVGCSCMASAQVKVWLDRLTIPVSEEGLPDVNPPFDAFETSRFNYPYTLRTSMTGRTITRQLRAIYLENEYLKCSMLPDIGGHLYSCTDKISGREMFYANPSLKKQLIGYRGAWAAFGIEFNFPVSHNWMSMSPVDFAFRQNPDRSASIFVANIDRPYGMQWRVELKLRPGSTLLEQRVTLYNHGDMRRRYYWWNNAAAEVGDDSRIQYPMRFSASHGFTFVDTWPVNHQGLDVSLIKNQTAGPVSQFVHGSREPFMGVWHPRWNAGVVHYADYGDLPAKKVWSWGVDADGLDWRRALSDNNSAYVEIQAGLFRNQETYSFLPPQSTIRFSEFWMPVRDIGGISRANLHGVVCLQRVDGKLRVGLNVNHAEAGARIRVFDGDRTLLDVRESLDPARTFSREIAEVSEGREYRFEVADAKGQVLIAHTEGAYDWTPESEIHTGPQHEPNVKDDPLRLGEDHELNGRLLMAMDMYQHALQRTPDAFELNKAAGRLAVTLKDYEQGVQRLERAQLQVSNDPELHYYLGHAYMGLGNSAKARSEWEGAQRQPQLRPAARVQLAFIAAREHRFDEATRLLQDAIGEEPGMVRAGAAEVALLRSSGNSAHALERVEYWLREDPTNSWLRYERALLSQTDQELPRHLGSDPERVLEIATDYINLGLYKDAVDLLSRRYPAHDSDEAEPGTALPQDHPLVAYYRGYCRGKLGQSGVSDYAAAAQLSTSYVFPYRPTTLSVLKDAVSRNPSDAIAHFFLGNIYMSAGMIDTAIAEWERARSLNTKIPTLHRNLGKTLLALKHDDEAAVRVFQQGVDADPTNAEVYSGLTTALSITRHPASERVAVLRQYPNRVAAFIPYPSRAKMPSSLAIDLALSYGESGNFREAEQMFHNRTFEKEEGAPNVRQVYIELRLQEALAHARGGRAAEARAVLATLAKPVAGIEFTRDGMEAFDRDARFEFYRGNIDKALGDADSARQHWKHASEGRGVFGALAARELGSTDWRTRMERIATGQGSPIDRALAELALGRTGEAERALIEVLRSPDRNLSHYLARQALITVSK